MADSGRSESVTRDAAVVFRSGNIFASKAHVVTITVNCVGVMGKGIALEAKQRHPDLFREYAALCAEGRMRLGQPVYIPRLMPPSFLLFPTKDHWRSVSKLADIEAGLKYLVDHYREWRIQSLAMPPLGCGNGGLEWAVVGPALHRALSAMEIPVELYLPSGMSAESARLGDTRGLTTPDDVEKARRTSPPEVVALVLALERALQLRPEKPVGRVLMQKLAYFSVAAGIPAPIKYARNSYGPYSSEWMSQIRHLVNNGLLVERHSHRGDAFAYEPGPCLREYVQKLTPALAQYVPAIERAARAIARFTPDQAEFAATAHMVATELNAGQTGPVSDEQIVAAVQHWKRRRGKPFDTDRILSCLAWLRSEGWLRSTEAASAESK